MDEQKIRADSLRAAVDLVTAAGVGSTSPDELFKSVFSVAEIFADYTRTGSNPCRPSVDQTATVAQPAIIESDADFRRRIQGAAGSATIHQERILADAGAALDEVGGFYGLERKKIST